MAAKKRWQDLTERQRRFIVAAATVEGALKVAALADLKRRPAQRIRGPKGLWAAGLLLVNGGGVAPLGYFVLGRRRPD